MRRRWLGRGYLTRFGCAALAALGMVWCHPSEGVAAELVLVEPAPCTTLDELSFRVEQLLGQPLAELEAMQLSVRIQVEPAGIGARLEVARLRAADRGVRSLHAATCEELSESLVLAILVAIGVEAEPTVRALAASTPAPDEVAPVPPVERVEPEPLGAGLSLAGSAWIIGDTGTLPAAGFGVGVGAALVWPSVELRAIGTLLPEREGSVNVSDSSSPGASIGLISGGALACIPVAVHQSTLALAACVGWELGQLSGSGTHVSIPYQQRTLWSAARLDLAARWAFPRTALSLELLVTAAAPFTRDDFILKDIGSVHRPASVLGRLGLGLGVAID